jgi:broad specificity phosphatase PhoE
MLPQAPRPLADFFAGGGATPDGAREPCIVLVRHGEPSATDNPVVDAAGFARWARRYERSRIRGTAAPSHLKGAFEGFLAVASERPRSLHSAYMCLDRDPDVVLPGLHEMEIPRYRLPFRLRAYSWLVLNRVVWFAGVRGRFESFDEARRRADVAAREIDALARAHGRIVVFGHGLMNRAIASRLVVLGWRGRPRRTRYWGTICLSAPSRLGARIFRKKKGGESFDPPPSLGCLQVRSL